MDPRAVQARKHHRAALDADTVATTERGERDRLVRELSADGFGYLAIARMVGCSKELVRLIVKEAG